MTTADRKRLTLKSRTTLSLRHWVKEETRNMKLAIHMFCLLMIVAVAVVLGDVHMLMASLPMFAQEGGDFLESI